MNKINQELEGKTNEIRSTIANMATQYQEITNKIIGMKKEYGDNLNAVDVNIKEKISQTIENEKKQILGIYSHLRNRL
jgi:archaellum component FlaC